MNNSSKIPGYTLSEMIVVLILTSVVVGLAFSVLTLVQKHIFSIRQNYSQNTELHKLELSLSLDFNHYSSVEFKFDELHFSNAIDSVSYGFESEYIIKDRDTFNISLNHNTFYFSGIETQKGQVDAIKLETSKRFQNQHLFVFKKNDAHTYMN